jgi:hypothetical protein
MRIRKYFAISQPHIVKAPQPGAFTLPARTKRLDNVPSRHKKPDAVKYNKWRTLE